MEFPIWKVVTSLGEVYEVKARTPKEFALKVQRMWAYLPWEGEAKVLPPRKYVNLDFGAQEYLSHYMEPHRYSY